MKCKTCGTEYEGKFCPGCGAPAENSDQSTKWTAPVQSAAQQQVPPSYAQAAKGKPKKPIIKKWWFWAIILVVVIGVAIKLGGNNTVSTNNNGSSQTTEDLSSVQTEFTLTAGYYTAGVDIPAGKCDVTAVSGNGNLYSSNAYSGGINAVFGIDDGSGIYTSSFNGLKLPKNTVLKLTSDLTIKLVYTSVDSGFAGRTYDESKATTLTDGNYVAGTDFTTGTYKIIAVSGQGNLISTNMFNGGLNEIFGIDNGMGYYNSQFVNATFDSGTTLTVSGGLTVKLIPANN